MMRFDSLLTQLTRTLSGVRAKAHVADIARYHRIQASPGYDDAVDHVRGALRRVGIGALVSSFPADGRTETFGWAAPIGWRIRSGSLRQVAPNERSLCCYDEVPISILGQSAGGSAEGELTHIGKGTTPEDVEGLNLTGRFVLACGRATEVLKRIRGKGAAGLIVYPDTERAAASYDLVQYAGLFPKADELETTPMGFSISRRAADCLIAQLEKGAVRLQGEVDAEYFDGSMQILEAEIRGSDLGAGEVLLVAHLCHPSQSANDNASGSGLLIEIARALSEICSKDPLKNTVRCVWVPEFNGTLPWAAANAETLRNVQFAINLDMVGQSPEVLGEPLRVFRAPNARPAYLNACFEPILSRIAKDETALSSQGSRHPFHWILDAPSGGSDHLVFQAAPHGLPAVMLGHDDPYWHTDLDTIDKVDPTRLKHVGLLTAALAALPTWAADEALLLGEWLLAFSSRELTRASGLTRQIEPEWGRRLVATALAIEKARAAALQRLVGTAAWDAESHFGVLGSIEQALVGSLPWSEAAVALVPRRALDGPVRFTIVDRFTEEEKAFFDEKLSANHRAVVESLVNLCDGTLDIREIALCLTLDFDRPFSVADTERSVELLAKAGYLV
jgi:hypothetical protein